MRTLPLTANSSSLPLSSLSLLCLKFSPKQEDFCTPKLTPMVISTTITDSDEVLHSTFASRYVRTPVPRFKMPEKSMPKEAAYQVINDELMLDGNPRLNLASFVTTWMEPECNNLIMASINKNYVDMDEYPVTTELQVCWEKFARYFEVELKEVKLKEGYYVMDPVKAVEMVDENTICIAAILGSTLTGEFEDVKLLSELLTKRNEETGWNTPIHVDAASGGFIAPFVYPDLEWDFRLPLVKSINVSGHKYGLVYAGVGWVVWRTKEDLPEELIFHINYLGSDQPTFTLNFSKGSSQIIAQYYQFIRLGFEGYKEIIENCMDNARALKQGLQKTGRFDIVSKDVGVPLVAFSLKDSSKYNVFQLSESLRRFGWIIPAYTMPADAQHIAVLRVVVREDFSRGLAERLVKHIEQVLEEMESLHGYVSTKATAVKQQPTESTKGKQVTEKSEREKEEHITRHWRSLVDGKRVGVC
ncbi:glutamate decarboxylase isoform X2 [Ricinus communis]|uniref:glutamate decarboxylase isoform X2 n=1 Tax=Ricinus communis TaxID=3988 RepID=UPI00201A6AE7|nr:glutamate decarboxylase isoform X2 [Ricinus communis]